MQISFATQSTEQTQKLGERLGARLFPGALLTLTGEMGAGKTAFIGGICRGAGCRTRASSPTYALMHLYEGPVPVYHFDLYRVAEGDAWVAMEVEELMDGRNIVLIEWPGPVAAILPGDRLDIDMDPGDTDDERRFRVSGSDIPWKGILEGWVS